MYRTEHLPGILCTSQNVFYLDISSKSGHAYCTVVTVFQSCEVVPVATFWTKSILWLLMPYLLLLPGHWKALYWLCSMNQSLSSMWKDFNHLHYLILRDDKKYIVYVYIVIRLLKNSAQCQQGLIMHCCVTHCISQIHGYVWIILSYQIWGYGILCAACSACWACFMCHHELWPTSVSHPLFSFNSSSMFRPYWRKTLPENYYPYLWTYSSKFLLFQVAFLTVYSFLLLSFLLTFFRLVFYCSLWLCFSKGIS